MVLAVNDPAGRSVLNVLVVLVVLPFVPVAVTVTLYRVAACNGHTVCHPVWPCSVPAAVAWPSDTVTSRILPCATVTDTPRLVFTFLAPFAGFITTWAASLARVFAPPPDPWTAVFAPDDKDPEQAVTSRHRAPPTPVIASPARRPLSGGRPVSVRSLSRTLVPPVVPTPEPGRTPTATASHRCGVLGRLRRYRCRAPRVLGNAIPDLGR